MLGLPLDGGTLDIDTDIWCHRLPLEAAAEAFELARDRTRGAIKVVLEPGAAAAS